ncbi:hypothetical protein ACE1YR_10140 [Pseudomonas sp. K1(2024)]|uniref:Uncharacterized protein n=1 Tax=Pseudomonas boreofloridensis TaxID=3064348 RepID=A0ABV4Z822_9PSED|nr:hypothetical protein [Pseudomonas sp. K13]MDO7902453.1 hypothetical protein [Pseudomonas sp. K13]
MLGLLRSRLAVLELPRTKIKIKGNGNRNGNGNGNGNGNADLIAQRSRTSAPPPSF